MNESLTEIRRNASAAKRMINGVACEIGGQDKTQRSAAAQLRQQKEQAETANIAKSSFLAGMSHEMRTPLMTARVLVVDDGKRVLQLESRIHYCRRARKPF